MSEDAVPYATPRPQDVQPCVLCGALVLSGQTTDGQTLHLDVTRPAYAVAWSDAAQAPLFFATRAYVVHQCVQHGAGTGKGKKKPVRFGVQGKSTTVRAPLDPERDPSDWQHLTLVDPVTPAPTMFRYAAAELARQVQQRGEDSR